MTTPATNVATQPVYFIPHGAGPCFFMDWNPSDTWEAMVAFLKAIEHELPERPKAILLISAHWLAPEFSVTAGPAPELIYDYYGFPEHTYELKYPAPGDPELAKQVTGLLQKAGLAAREDPVRGFDHGMFIPLKVMFPEADIPVVQLSLAMDLGPKIHLAAGKALASLRDEGVLIVGSGMSFHNMRGYGDARYTAPSARFDSWLTEAVENSGDERVRRLENWSGAPHAHDCHPRGHEEHLIPLMVTAGAAGDNAGKRVYTQQVMKTQLSGFRFG